MRSPVAQAPRSPSLSFAEHSTGGRCSSQIAESDRHDKARRVCVFPCRHHLPAGEPVLLERNLHSPYVLVGCQESGSDHHDQITVTTPQTLPEAVRQDHKGCKGAAPGRPRGACWLPQVGRDKHSDAASAAQLNITSATPITALPGFHQPRKSIFEATTVASTAYSCTN